MTRDQRDPSHDLSVLKSFDLILHTYESRWCFHWAEPFHGWRETALSRPKIFEIKFRLNSKAETVKWQNVVVYVWGSKFTGTNILLIIFKYVYSLATVIVLH